MQAFVARDWDGRLTLFRGNRPVRVIHDRGSDWRCGDGTAAQCGLHRDLFPTVRCGECCEVVVVENGEAA